MGKIIFVNRYFYPDLSATSQMLSDLAFGLNLEGVEVHIVTSRQRYDDASAELPKNETINDVHVHRVWTSWFGRQNLFGRAVDYFSFYLFSAVKLLRLTKRDDVIVAKTDPPLISIVAALVASIKSARLINWVQDLFPEVAAELRVKFLRGPFYLILRYLRNLALFRAEQNVVLGRLMRERLKREGVAEEAITVIPNWADGKNLQPIERRENALRKRWGLCEKFVVGYSGNLGRSHDFSTILEAAKLLEDNTDIVFLFIGGGAQLSWVKQQVIKEDLSNVLFQDYQPQNYLSESLSVPDVHLISLKPSLEGLIVPSKFYGIAAVGKPSIFIGDSKGEIACLLHDYNCGYSVQQGENDKLVELLLRFNNATHKDGYVEKADRIRRIFDESFDFSNVLAQWNRVFHQYF